jgi:hypothetical protein
MLLNLIVEGQTEIMKINKTPLRTNVQGAEVYNPQTILITGAEYDTYLGEKGTCSAGLPTEGGVYGRSNAICKALSGVIS